MVGGLAGNGAAHQRLSLSFFHQLTSASPFSTIYHVLAHQLLSSVSFFQVFVFLIAMMMMMIMVTVHNSHSTLVLCVFFP